MRRVTVTLAAVAAVAVSALLIPYWMGVRTEHEMRILAGAASRAGDLHVQIIDYRRGWFSSLAKVRVILAPVSQTGQRLPRLSFDFRERIDHGPYPLADLGVHGWAPVQAVIHSAWTGFGPVRFADRPELPPRPLTAVTVVWLSGVSDTNLRMPAWQLRRAGPGITRVAWGGLRGRMQWSGDFAHVREQFTSPGLEIDGVRASAKVHDLSLHVRVHRAPSGLMQGTMALRAASLDAAFRNGKRADVAVADLSLHSVSTEHQGVMGLVFEARASTVRAGSVAVGPFDYKLRLKRVDTAALVRLQEAMRRVGARADAPAAFRQELTRLLPQLLRRSPELVLDALSLQTPAGPISLRGRVRLPQAILRGPDGWKAVVARATLKVPQKLLRSFLSHQARSQLAAARGRGAVPGISPAQIGHVADLMARQRLQALQARGLLLCEAGQCRAAVRVDSGRVNVNGRSVALPGRPE